MARRTSSPVVKKSGDLLYAAEVEDMFDTIDSHATDIENIVSAVEDFADHAQRIDNPHNVTKAQLALEFVDNTSDLNKPVSTATNTAINGRTTPAQVDAKITAFNTQIQGGAPTDANTLAKLLGKISALQSLLNGDDVNLDSVKELADAIKASGSTLTNLTSSKINVTDIYNALDYAIAGKVLDARMGKALSDAIALRATIANPAFTGTPTAPTPVAGTNNSQIATTKFFFDNLPAPPVAPDLTPYATKDSPVFTGSPVAPTPSNVDASTKVATTAHVRAQQVPLTQAAFDALATKDMVLYIILDA